MFNSQLNKKYYFGAYWSKNVAMLRSYMDQILLWKDRKIDLSVRVIDSMVKEKLISKNFYNFFLKTFFLLPIIARNWSCNSDVVRLFPTHLHFLLKMNSS